MGGALPDLLNPHLSLAARYSSWSHTVFAWTAFAAAMLGLAWWPRLRTWRIPLLLAAPAYALHLAADAVSGGIVWLHPLSDAVVGTRLIRYRWWWPIDGALVALATVFFASWPAWRRAQPAALRTETLP